MNEHVAKVKKEGIKASKLSPKDFFLRKDDPHMMCEFPEAVNLETAQVIRLKKNETVRKLKLEKKMVLALE